MFRTVNWKFLGQALLGLCCEKRAKFMRHGCSFQLQRVVKTSRKTHVTNKFSSVCYMTHTRCGVKYGIQSRCKSSWPAPSPMLVTACRGHQIPVEELHQTEIQVTRTEHSKIKGYYAKQLQLHALKWKYNSECWFKCIFYISAISGKEKIMQGNTVVVSRKKKSNQQQLKAIQCMVI